MARDTHHLDRQVATIRGFNRFYTRRIGLLDEHFLGSDFSLPEMRVLWEIGDSGQVTASRLEHHLGLDAGYVSRLVRKLREAGLVESSPDAKDARVKRLALTDKGRRTFAPLERRSAAEAREILEALSPGDRGQVVGAMESIRRVLEREPHEGYLLRLREPRPGDLGWVVARHGALYAQEYGWDFRFEGLVAEIVGRFAATRKPGREHCWIAEHQGERVGSVFLVEKSRLVGQLRLLLVEPEARGRGVGRALVRECIRAARANRYRKLVLWTNEALVAARRIYAGEGFRRIRTDRSTPFSQEYWELAL
jgi:DNA-binding MarR family transcriptional regulator/GNAT superfamily N-acetyltransferase